MTMKCEMVDVAPDDAEAQCDTPAIWRVTAIVGDTPMIVMVNSIYCHNHATATVEYLMDDERYNSIMARKF